MNILSHITKDKPNEAIKTAVWWIEYVLRHNGALHLRSANTQIKWCQEYLLDILATILVVFVVLILILFYIFNNFMKYFNSKYGKIKTQAKLRSGLF